MPIVGAQTIAGVTAAVLAGGHGTRLGGVAKPLLRVGDATILERQLAVLRPLAVEVLIVAAAGDAAQYAAYAGPGVRVIEDLRRDAGPLAGLEAALAASATEAVLAVAGDMPLLHPAALALVLAARPEADAAVVEVGGRYEPLHARYARRVLPRVRAALDAGRRSLARLLDDLDDVARVPEADLRARDPELRTLANVNTPEDLDRVTRLAGA